MNTTAVDTFRPANPVRPHFRLELPVTSRPHRVTIATPIDAMPIEAAEEKRRRNQQQSVDRLGSSPPIFSPAPNAPRLVALGLSVQAEIERRGVATPTTATSPAHLALALIYGRLGSTRSLDG